MPSTWQEAGSWAEDGPEDQGHSIWILRRPSILAVRPMLIRSTAHPFHSLAVGNDQQRSSSATYPLHATPLLIYATPLLIHALTHLVRFCLFTRSGSRCLAQLSVTALSCTLVGPADSLQQVSQLCTV